MLVSNYSLITYLLEINIRSPRLLKRHTIHILDLIHLLSNSCYLLEYQGHF